MKTMSLSEISNINTEICLFGITAWSLLIAKINSDKRSIYFADNNIKFQGKETVNGFVCKKPNEISSSDIVIITLQNEKYINDISEQLMGLGIKEIYCLVRSEMIELRNTIDNEKLLEALWFLYNGYEIKWNKLQTLNEKMQLIKLRDKRQEYVLYADKFKVREYIKKEFGEKYLIPLLMVTNNVEDVVVEKMPDEPFAIKTNCWSGDVEIVRKKNSVDWDIIQERFRKIFVSDYSKIGGEWWYGNMKPCIVVEKLLVDRNGKLPNDYKFHFINSKLEFIYCSVDREGENYRKIYSPEWKEMQFAWNGTSTPPDFEKKNIEPPQNFDLMVKMGQIIAEKLPYVRVDYYEVEGKLYFGEITISHGAGYDKFIPQEYDVIYGRKLDLKKYGLQY